MVSEFARVNVSTQQIYNHLRKWRQRWVKIVRLKDLSGALWDEDHHMIVLDDEHLLGHTKVRNCLDNTSAIPFAFAPLCLIVISVSLTRTILLMLNS